MMMTPPPPRPPSTYSAPIGLVPAQHMSRWAQIAAHPATGVVIGGTSSAAVVAGTGVGMGYLMKQYRHMDEQSAMARKQNDMAEEQHKVVMEVQNINRALAQKQLLQGGPILSGGLTTVPTDRFRLATSTMAIGGTVAVVIVAGTLIYLRCNGNEKKETVDLVTIITELDQVKEQLDKETESGDSGAVMAALVRRRVQLEQKLMKAS